MLLGILTLLLRTSATATPHCWIYNEIYPVTVAAYRSQHVTLAERKEIDRWAAQTSPSQERLVRAQSPWARPPSASEQNLVRWMRSYNGSVLVFVARSIKRSGNEYSPWVALNANVIIDTELCEVHAYPAA